MGAIDPRSFGDALGAYASGITIISGVLDGVPLGFPCQSFYSASLDPPQVSFSVMRSSSRWPKVRSGGTFAVNVLAAHQADISTALGRSAPDAWTCIEWTASP
jgi:3-hydroxy-9,10-secoandrosta-1,3,5(10)-triene-9,17-dione monooxygenase reductase component